MEARIVVTYDRDQSQRLPLSRGRLAEPPRREFDESGPRGIRFVRTAVVIRWRPTPSDEERDVMPAGPILHLIAGVNGAGKTSFCPAMR